MNQNRLKLAKAGIGIALTALLAGQWSFITGPVKALGEQGRIAAENGHMGELAFYAGSELLLTIASPLIFGGIGLCVVMAYLAFQKMENRKLEGIHDQKTDLRNPS